MTEGTARSYWRAYRDGGVEALYRFNPHPSSAALDDHAETLHDAFASNPPHTVQEAVDRIHALTGIKRIPAQVQERLKKHGFSRRKTGQIPAKADPVAQKRFLEDELPPVLDEAQAGKRHVFFGDAAHFVLGAWLGYLWCLTRILLPTPSGRRRFNVWGALHAVTHEIVTVTNDTYINQD